MLSWRRIGMAILWLVGGGLQGVVWLWTLLASVGFTAGLGLIVSYLRDMPAPLFWVLIVVAFILLFATLNHLAARHTGRQQQHDVQPGVPTVGHANNVYFSPPPASRANEEKTRREINSLLGNALEEGESLKQGRRYAIGGTRTKI